MRWLAAALACASLLLGCETTELPRLLGEQCDLNSQCETPLVCRIGRCRRECATARDCPAGQLCAVDSKGLGACLLPEEKLCAVDSDCEPPLICRSNGCTNECATDRDCAPGASCEEERCIDPADMSCGHDIDCPPDLRCAPDGRCRAACREDRDCREGEECTDGQCTDIPLPDAGTPDAGPPDAGRPDAGPDDAGPMDAGGGECETADDCTAPNVATAACESGVCTLGSCAGGFADCDGDFATGCEVDTAGDPRNCGACAAECGRGGVCTSGSCDVVAGIALGARHVCFLRSSGTMLCAGHNHHGELGNGTACTTGCPEDLQAVVGVTDATAVELGAGHSCAVDASGGAHCWGDNSLGQVGDGTWTTRHSPRAVGSLTGVDEVVSGGRFFGFTTMIGHGFGCARVGGAVHCWGAGDSLGDGSGTNSNVPVAVSGVTDAIALAAGGSHACAVRAGGAVACWGDGGARLGDGTTTGVATTPVAVSGVTNAVDVAAGDAHTCAVLDGGTVSCWGSNASGQVGPGVSVGSSTNVPVAVTGITDAVAVGAGTDHTCVLRTGGGVSCWGANGLGQLGNDSTTDSATPVDVAVIDDATLLAVGDWKSCVVRADGTVWCWGSAPVDYGIPGAGGATWNQPMAHPDFPATP